MANHKSAEKAYRRSVKKNLFKRSRLNKTKTYVKKALNAIESNEDYVVVSKIFRDAQSAIAKSLKAGCFKANTAARQISSLTLKLNKKFTQN